MARRSRVGRPATEAIRGGRSVAESPLPLRRFSGCRRRGPGASSSAAQHTPRAPGLQLSRSGREAPVRALAALCEADWACSPARARFLLRPFGPRGPREAPFLGGAVTGRAGAEGPARWPPLGPRLRHPFPAAAIKNVDGRPIFLIFKLLSWSP